LLINQAGDQRIGLLFKPENRIDFTAAPHNADGMSLPDGVLPDHELVLQIVPFDDAADTRLSNGL
jgi:hypothetical protein